jgi:hypothetical protein
MLRSLTRVHDLEELPDPTVEGVTLDSADGRYRIELLVEGADQAALRALLLDLTAEDPLGFSRLMESVRWEMPSELEETALRFRWARLGPRLPRPGVGGRALGRARARRAAAPARALSKTRPAGSHPGRPRWADADELESAWRSSGPHTRHWSPTVPIQAPEAFRAAERAGTPWAWDWSCSPAEIRRVRRKWCATRRSGASSRSASPWGCG